MKLLPPVALCLAAAAALFAQSAPQAQRGGQADVVFQGYYLGANSQPVTGTAGMAVRFQEFIPGFGTLHGNLEAYRTEGTIQPADNFVELRGLVWLGLRWNLTGGDFRAPGTLLRNPFNNLFFPEINARGAQLDVGDSTHGFTLFYGRETLLGGPRIPFRISTPQVVMGAGIRQSFGHLETGVRLLHFMTTPGADENPFFFQPGREFRTADNLTAYTAYSFNDHFRWYGEATAARAETAQGQRTGPSVSYFFGPAWDSPRVTFRMNYAELGRAYLPVAGYSVGDRKGPFGELRIRPLSQVELFGSASQYETVTKRDPVLPYLRSTATSGGVSLQLPWNFSASAQLSTIDFYSLDPQTSAAQRSANRQWTGTLSRPISRHTLRFTGRDMRLILNGALNRQRAAEIEDTFQLHHFVVGAAVRAQQSTATDRRNSVYVRGSAQANLGRLSAYGYFEGGKDLVNQSVFATSATSSSVVAVTLRLTRRWSLQGEAFRSRLISSLNPENVFVQVNQGLAVDPVLSRFNQWSFLFRIVRSFNWGGALPAGNIDQYTIQRIPLTGIVEGFVHVRMAAGQQPAPGIGIKLESGRTVLTDANGKFRFDDVPEGAHAVAIDMERLPADYNPGQTIISSVTVGPRKIARADLDLYALSSFTGKVTLTSGAPFDTLEGIVIRLEPDGQYTTTLKDGSFAFYNLPDGSYEAGITESTLPPEAILKTSSKVPVTVHTGSVPAAVEFKIERRPVQQKPVRKVLDQTIKP